MNYETNTPLPGNNNVALTVIIPTYNRAGLIKYAIESLDAKYHPGVSMEIIVVDDGSEDGTWTYIEKNHPQVRLIRNDKKGAASARNKGLAAAQGKYIVYLDSDDLIGPNYFAKKIAFLEANTDYHAVYGTYEAFASDGPFSENKIVFRHKYPMLEGYRNGRDHLVNFLSGNFTPCNSIVWHKRFLVKIKGQDESLSINQDVELFIRAIFKGLLITAVDDGTNAYVRVHSLDKRVGDQNNETKKWRQMLELRKKIHADLRIYAYDEGVCYAALSSYLFDQWKLLRHSAPGIADAYLNFAKSVYWPVRLKGGVGLRLLSAFLGPVRAVNAKYFLLKRD